MLNIGLIGLGKMGKYHLNLYDEIAGIKLTALCDADKKSVEGPAATCNVPAFTDYRDILPLVDAVTVAAPTKYHYEIAKTCLEAGKHVLVEKPITTDYDEAKELFDIAHAKNSVLHIGHVERFNGAVQELKNIVSSPRVFETRRVGPFNPSFKNDSIVLDLMIHDIDIVVNLAPGTVRAVQAMGAPVHTELVDYASVNLYFDGGLTANIFVSRINQNKERFLKVVQDDALIVLDYTNQDINIIRQGQSQQIMGEKELKYRNEFTQERLFVYKDNPLKMEIKHFIDCINGNAQRFFSVEHDLSALEVALAVDKLLLEGNYGAMEL